MLSSNHYALLDLAMKLGTEGATKALETALRKKERANGTRVTKGGTMFNLLLRPEGASIKELMEATSWQQHSIRGWISTQRKAGVPIKNSQSRYYAG